MSIFLFSKNSEHIHHCYLAQNLNGKVVIKGTIPRNAPVPSRTRRKTRGRRSPCCILTPYGKRLGFYFLAFSLSSNSFKNTVNSPSEVRQRSSSVYIRKASSGTSPTWKTAILMRKTSFVHASLQRCPPYPDGRKSPQLQENHPKTTCRPGMA